MSENLESIKEYLGQIVTQKFLPHLFSRIDQHKQFLLDTSILVDDYENLFNKLKIENEIEFFTEAEDLNKRILAKLESRFHISDDDSLLTDLEMFNSDLENFVNKTEKRRIEIQLRERFYFQQGDKLYIRILKFFKINAYRISIIPAKIRNMFLKLFKRRWKEINYWHHRIPLQDLREYYIKDRLFINLLELYRKTRAEQTASLHALKKYSDNAEIGLREKKLNLNEENITSPDFKIIRLLFDEAINSLESLKDSLSNKSNEIVEQIIANYYEAYIRINTIELSAKRVSSRSLVKSEKESEKVFNKIHQGWNNTLFTLADDWRMDLELYITRYNLIYNYLKTSDSVSDKINNNVRPQYALINNLVEELIEQIRILKKSNSDLKRYLIEGRYKLKSVLTDKLIPQAIDALLNQDILGNLDNLEYTVEQSISGMSDKRALVKTDLYDREIKDSEISYISMRDMLSFSSLQEFKESASKTKTDISLKLQKIQNSLLEIDQISDFSLESAQIILKEKSKEITRAEQIVIEGLERASKKMDEIDDQLFNLESSFSQKIKEALDKLNEGLINLTYTESILELKIKITKERALSKSRELRKKAIQNIKGALPLFLNFIKNGFKRSVELYIKVRKLIGIQKEVTIIKGEVSEFLAETGEAINKLPFVYQRLFVVEPIEDKRFFFGQEEELEKLKIAYENWSAGKYSPTIIYGEKGSGATSMLNIFIKQNIIFDKLIRISVNEIVYLKENFLMLFSNIADKKEFKTLEELKKYFNDNRSGKKIVIIENLQHLYLRKINGFENLRLLFDLIAETNENVFWIITCTIYSLRYLQKTIAISDYFANEIQLGQLTDKQIFDIIQKRHRVSGYDVYYETSNDFAKSKNFQRLSDSEKKEKLEKTYFSLLNKFAESNISMALLFWVRSTKSISDDKITIGHLPKIDFDFLSYLSSEKIFTLNLLLIHDGLSDKDLSLINGKTIENCKRLFTTLEDDGIVVKRNQLYLLNPLLYRPIVEVLKSKNIVH